MKISIRVVFFFWGGEAKELDPFAKWGLVASGG